MKLKKIIKELDLKIFNTKEIKDIDIDGAYVSDLLSDVMGNAKEHQIWITLQAHKNVIAVATLKDIPAIILINKVIPEQEMLDVANEEGIAVLGTSEMTFEISGKLYEKLNK